MAGFNSKSVRLLFPIISVLALHFFGPTFSEGASKEKISMTLVKGQKINQPAIHKDYQNGDFEIVLKDISDFQKLNKTYDLDDSIFIAKHLSVIYSADPATREKGKYWMHQLLKMMPSAQLLDMYVSEEIDRIFGKVQSEYIAARRSMG